MNCWRRRLTDDGEWPFLRRRLMAEGSMQKKLETAASIATLVVAGLLGYVLLDRYVLHKIPPSPASISSGDKLSLADVDWARNGRTLVLVLQKGCHFCSESAPFYQKLVEQTGRPGKPHLMAVLPQSPKESADYLSAIGVPIGDVRHARPTRTGCAPVPRSRRSVSSWNAATSSQAAAVLVSWIRRPGSASRSAATRQRAASSRYSRSLLILGRRDTQEHPSAITRCHDVVNGKCRGRPFFGARPTREAGARRPALAYGWSAGKQTRTKHQTIATAL